MSRSGQGPRKKAPARVRSPVRYQAAGAPDSGSNGRGEIERDREMTLGAHLEELRRRILLSIAVITVSSVTIGWFIMPIHAFLTAPYRELTGLLLYLGSAYTSFQILIQVSLLLGILVSFPVVLFVLWGFAAPAVANRTAALVRIAMGASAFLFWSGVALCWFYLFPISLGFLFKEFLPPGTTPQVTLEKYYDFLFMLHVGSGIVFQMPLVFVILGAAGILTMEFHKRAWRMIVVAIVVFAAIITPPDPLSQIFLMVPLLVFYVGSLIIIWFIERSRRKRALRGE